MLKCVIEEIKSSYFSQIIFITGILTLFLYLGLYLFYTDYKNKLIENNLNYGIFSEKEIIKVFQEKTFTIKATVDVKYHDIINSNKKEILHEINNMYTYEGLLDIYASDLALKITYGLAVFGSLVINIFILFLYRKFFKFIINDTFTIMMLTIIFTILANIFVMFLLVVEVLDKIFLCLDTKH